MWSEEMDDKIRGAAENDMPAYNEKTWQGMEALLNQHLPQKKKRRGFLFFLVPALLIAVTGVVVMLKYPGDSQPAAGNRQSAAGRQQSAAGNELAARHTQPEKGNSKQPADIAGKNTGGNGPLLDVQVTGAGIGTVGHPDNTVKQTTSGKTPLSFSKNGNSNAFITAAATSTAIANPATGKNEQNQQQQIIVPSTTGTAANVLAAISNAGPVKENTIAANQPAKPATVSADSTTTLPVAKMGAAAQSDSSTTAVTTAQPKKDLTRNRKAGRFFISVSAGADVSSVAAYKAGKLKSEYGAGIGYTFGRHLTVRTGFYIGRKIYSADSNTYRTSNTSGPYSYRLSEIDANCLVYEVPVLVSYSFGQTPKHSWFASTGLSSYFMKKEDYTYIYKASGSQYTYDYSFANQNRHIFSVLDLSAGYQHQFSKRFSLVAEPYLKLPLTGIGAGSVKLNSAGVLVSAVIRPFAR